MRKYITDAQKALIAKPDIRMRSNGSAESRALMYITEAGEKFVRNFAAKTKGVWRAEENTFWVQDILFPVKELKASGLRVVAGIGTTDEHDRPWQYYDVE
jgi:hypothetical protein